MLNVTRAFLPPFEEYCEEIKELWASHAITNMGVKHKALQAGLQDYLDCPHVTLFANGHLALENALAALKLPAGSEVITTPFTFASTAHAIARNGLTPVFCDIEPEHYTIDANILPRLITKKTSALLPVHVYGSMCDVSAIQGVADVYGLKVVYDAAHAFGASYKGKSFARFGDMTMYSFHATKVFSTIEGGAVCHMDGERAALLDDLKNFGIRGEEEVAIVAGNAKLNEFQAAMGLCALRHIGGEIAGRKRAHEMYMERLSGAAGIKLPAPQKDVVSNYAYFPVVFDGYKRSRDELHRLLQENGIAARKYFYPLLSDTAAYKNSNTLAADTPSADTPAIETPVAKWAANNVLALPLYAGLAENDVQRICEIILK